jgi:hypothetical protein
MDEDRHIWQIWADQLHRWGVRPHAATLLEVAGPLAIIGAQAMYVGQPFLRGLLPDDHWQALTGLLEDSQQAQDFADFLRGREGPA